jgi:hypothetical protein
MTPKTLTLNSIKQHSHYWSGGSTAKNDNPNSHLFFLARGPGPPFDCNDSPFRLTIYLDISFKFIYKTIFE